MKTLPRNQVLVGNAAEVLADLLPQSIDCVVTSPPYYGLRDYDVTGQLGSEARIAEWVAGLRRVFQGLARVLKPAGSVWLNLGDSYSRDRKTGAEPKSLYAASERLLVALMADGWSYRNRIVWAKPNPLPQSAADRLSQTHEVIYFLTRSRHYFFDLDAIRTAHRTSRRASESEATRRYQGGNSGLGALKAAGRVGHRNGKNPGDVWTIPTAVDRLGHQATFPEALVEPIVRAATPERICVQCDRAWTRPTRVLTVHTNEGARTVRKVGELQRCDCFAPTRPGVVLDPFFGTGTVGVVAERLGRDWLGIELNPAYAALAEQRIVASRRRAA